jgi:hypothetical protein
MVASDQDGRRAADGPGARIRRRYARLQDATQRLAPGLWIGRRRGRRRRRRRGRFGRHRDPIICRRRCAPEQRVECVVHTRGERLDVADRRNVAIDARRSASDPSA